MIAMRTIVEALHAEDKKHQCDRGVYPLVNRTLNDHGYQAAVLIMGESLITFAIVKRKLVFAPQKEGSTQ